MLPLVALKEVTPGLAVERPQSGRVGHMTEQLTLVSPERFLRRACQNGALVSPSISPLRLSTADSKLPTFCPNSFRFTHFRKNASATPLFSHTFKKRWGWGPFWSAAAQSLPREKPRGRFAPNFVFRVPSFALRATALSA